MQSQSTVQLKSGTAWIGTHMQGIARRWRNGNEAVDRGWDGWKEDGRMPKNLCSQVPSALCSPRGV